MKGFKNVKAFVDGKFIVTDIAFKDGEIIAISNNLPIDEPISVNGVVYPGFIDEHIHGVNNAEAISVQLLISLSLIVIQGAFTSAFER